MAAATIPVCHLLQRGETCGELPLPFLQAEMRDDCEDARTSPETVPRPMDWVGARAVKPSQAVSGFCAAAGLEEQDIWAGPSLPHEQAYVDIANNLLKTLDARLRGSAAKRPSDTGPSGFAKKPRKLRWLSSSE